MEIQSIFTDSIYGDNRALKADRNIKKLIETQLNNAAQRALNSAMANGNAGCSNCTDYEQFNIYKDEIGIDGNFRVRFSIRTTSQYFTIKSEIIHLDENLDRKFSAWRIEEAFDLARILHNELKSNSHAMAWHNNENSKNIIIKFLNKIFPIIVENAFKTFKENVIDKSC